MAVYPSHGATPMDVIKVADAALLRAKEAGRDRVELASGPAGLRMPIVVFASEAA